MLLSLHTVQAASPITLSPQEQAFIAEHPVIRVGGESAWAPIEFVAEGHYTGLARDYLDLISQRTGLRFEYVTGPTWQQLLDQFYSGHLDMLPVISWTPERSERMHFSEPYMTLRHYAYTRDNRSDLVSLNNLNGKRVAIPSGYSFAEIIAGQYPQIQVVDVDTSLQAIDAVVTGKADATFISTTLFQHYTRQNHITGLKAAFPATFGINELHMASRSDWPLLNSIIDKALASIDMTTRQRITSRWLNLSNADTPTPLLTSEERAYLQQKGEITYCIDPNWMPYEGIVKGRHSGMSADYLDYIARLLEVSTRLVPTTSWPQTLQFAQERRCDMVTLASNRPERREYLNFSRPYLETSLALATHPDAWFYSDFNEMSGQRIGVMRGYSPGKIIRQRYPEIEVIEFDTIREGLEQVRQGTLLGFLDAVPTLSYNIQRDFQGDLKINGKFDYDWDVSLGARNDEPLLISALDKAIAAIPDREHQRIRNSWLAVRYDQALDYALLWKLVGIFALILMALAFRYHQMSRYRKTITLKNEELAQINRQLEQQTEAAQHMAFHDQLTGLPNRFQLLENLNHALLLAKRQQRKLAVLFIDLDRFKYVNDSLGHHVGDELLKQLGQRIQKRLRESDTLARLGGDEFVVLLESIADETAAAKVSESIIQSLREPLEVRGHRLNITASIGIALFPDDSDDSHSLIRQADNAMYQAKELGRNHYRFYTPQLSEQTAQRLKVESAMREALQMNQFSLVFQPVIDLHNRRVSRAEVLLRWQHPQMGFIAPDYFIPIAEENGLIHDIGLWVTTQACATLQQWQQSKLPLEALAINVSSVQFQRDDFVSRIQMALHQARLEANQLEIEITERYLMEQTEEKIRDLNALKRAGHCITVDDFGIGYSSMSYMKRLPLDCIKIDRSFIKDIPEDANDEQISQAIIALSHNLGYKVVAEGVENEAQLAFLQRCGCDYAQGYLFSRPVTAAALPATIADLNARLKQIQPSHYDSHPS